MASHGFQFLFRHRLVAHDDGKMIWPMRLLPRYTGSGKRGPARHRWPSDRWTCGRASGFLAIEKPVAAIDSKQLPCPCMPKSNLEMQEIKAWQVEIRPKAGRVCGE